MFEILRTEQPCILCAQPIEVVTWIRDELSGEERIDRERLDHSERTCRETLALFREQWPATGLGF